MRYEWFAIVVLISQTCFAEKAVELPEADLLRVYSSAMEQFGSVIVFDGRVGRHELGVVSVEPAKILDFLEREFESDLFRTGTGAVGRVFWFENSNGSKTEFGAYEVFFDDIQVVKLVSELLASVGRQHFQTRKVLEEFEVFTGQRSILISFRRVQVTGVEPSEGSLSEERETKLLSRAKSAK